MGKDTMSQKRMEGLKASAAKKKKDALQKTEQAINFLIKNQQKITISSVAKLANVSTSYIYKYPELAYKIQTLRERQKYENKSLLSLSKQIKVVEEYRDRVNDLETEKADLNLEIQTLNSSIKNIIESNDSVEQLQASNVRLTVENQKLKQQLSRLEEEVYQLRSAILNREYIDDRDFQSESLKKSNIIQKVFEE